MSIDIQLSEDMRGRGASFFDGLERFLMVLNGLQLFKKNKKVHSYKINKNIYSDGNHFIHFFVCVHFCINNMKKNTQTDRNIYNLQSCFDNL